MTDKQKAEISKLREEGYGYAAIANILGLKRDNVRYYCKTNELDGVMAKSKEHITGERLTCAECGTALVSFDNKREKRFCSDKCRHSYWNKRRFEKHEKTKTQITAVCRCCGKPFYSYKSEKRIFCSAKCYMDYRFRRSVEND